MVNFQDPTVIFHDLWAVVKLWHAFDGLFLWELFITLDLEWSVIRGRRPYRWTIWVYSMARITTLVAVILNILRIDDSRSINCQLWVIFEHVFAYLALACALLLIVLRIIAIWGRNKTVLALATSVWGINVAFLIHGLVRLHAVWEPAENTCMVTNSYSFKLNILITLVTEIIFFVFMLVGLLRVRLHDGGLLKLGPFLWKQGVIWFLLAIVAEIPPAVFLILNLNGNLFLCISPMRKLT
ncbi:hypothetical protein BGW80DRAFT_231287 [Lactifluus volemus]|nr:hypothetical protein BGW80DRAFT_231287 [Lactifluus volemus]